MVLNSVKNFSMEKKLASLPGRTVKEDIYVPSIPKNILRGIVPVASVWGTDPTNLQKCTDGDMSTVTGTGSKVMGAAGNYGRLVFDIGVIKTVILASRFGIWSSAGLANVVVESSDDNITYRGYNNTAQVGTVLAGSVTSASEVVMDTATGVILTGRYISLGFWVGAAATANAKIYSIMAYELGL